LLRNGELVRLLCDHHRLLVYSENPRIGHAHAHVHTCGGVHTTGKAWTRSRVEEILHRQITELTPEGCGT
jgi:hypothetical protein